MLVMQKSNFHLNKFSHWWSRRTRSMCNICNPSELIWSLALWTKECSRHFKVLAIRHQRATDTHLVAILLRPTQPPAALPQVLDPAGRHIQATWEGLLQVDPHLRRQVMATAGPDGPSLLRATVPDRPTLPRKLDLRLQLQDPRLLPSPILDSRPIKILIR